MIVRINGRDETKHDLQVRLGEAMLRLGEEVHLDEEVRLGEAPLCLGGPESIEIMGSGSPRRSSMPTSRGVEQNAEMARFDPFHRKFPSNPKLTQPKLKINHKTHLIPTNNISNRIFPTQL